MLEKTRFHNGTKEGLKDGVRERVGRVTFPPEASGVRELPGGARVCMDRPESRPQPSGLSAEGASLFDTAFSSAAKNDWWIRAEKETAELITSIQPIRLSEKRRSAIANFVEHLIKARLDCIIQVSTLPILFNSAISSSSVPCRFYAACLYSAGVYFQI